MSWWNDFTRAVNDILGSGSPADLTAPVSNWLGSQAGQIGSGIESGFVSFIKDLWNFILGPVEIIAGTFIIVVALGVFLSGDVLGLFPGTRRPGREF